MDGDESSVERAPGSRYSRVDQGGQTSTAAKPSAKSLPLAVTRLGRSLARGRNWLVGQPLRHPNPIWTPQVYGRQVIGLRLDQKMQEAGLFRGVHRRFRWDDVQVVLGFASAQRWSAEGRGPGVADASDPTLSGTGASVGHRLWKNARCAQSGAPPPVGAGTAMPEFSRPGFVGIHIWCHQWWATSITSLDPLPGPGMVWTLKGSRARTPRPRVV